MYGITHSEAHANGYVGEMKNLPLSFAKEIYKKKYWDIHHCDEIAVWSETAAIELFECGVNQGVVTAAKHFQRAINILNNKQKYFKNVVVDGKIGHETLSAMTQINKNSDKLVALKLQNILQGARYIEIMERNESQEVFARGWLSRCAI